MDVTDKDNFGVSRQQTIDHEQRKGGVYEPKAALTGEQRRRRSERMKEYHRKTRIGTALGNARKRSTHRPE